MLRRRPRPSPRAEESAAATARVAAGVATVAERDGVIAKGRENDRSMQKKIRQLSAELEAVKSELAASEARVNPSCGRRSTG